MPILTSPFFIRSGRITALLILPAVLASLWLIHVEEKIRVRGIVEAADQVEVRSPVKETIVKECSLEVGATVKAGDVVLTFEDLSGFAAEAAKTDFQIRELEEMHKRIKPLSETGSVPEVEVKQLEYRIEALRVTHRDLIEKAERLAIRSPIDGRLVTIDVKPYQRAEIGTLLFTVAGEVERQIECNVLERHFTYLRIGQRVNIKSDVYNYLKYEVYPGTVVAVSPFGQSRDGGITHEVRIGLEGSAQQLPVGSAADCEIIVEGVPLIEIIFPRH